MRLLQALGEELGSYPQQSAARAPQGIRKSQSSWLKGVSGTPGGDGFRVACLQPPKHHGACWAQARIGGLIWRWDPGARRVLPNGWCQPPSDIAGAGLEAGLEAGMDAPPDGADR